MCHIIIRHLQQLAQSPILMQFHIPSLSCGFAHMQLSHLLHYSSTYRELGEGKIRDISLVRHHNASTLPINRKVRQQITSRSVSYWRMWADNPQLHRLFFVREVLPEVPRQKVVPKDITLCTALIHLFNRNTVTSSSSTKQ